VNERDAWLFFLEFMGVTVLDPPSCFCAPRTLLVLPIGNPRAASGCIAMPHGSPLFCLFQQSVCYNISICHK
jgi:hypothetical protein